MKNWIKFDKTGQIRQIDNIEKNWTKLKENEKLNDQIGQNWTEL